MQWMQLELPWQRLRLNQYGEEKMLLSTLVIYKAQEVPQCDDTLSVNLIILVNVR